MWEVGMSQTTLKCASCGHETTTDYPIPMGFIYICHVCGVEHPAIITKRETETCICGCKRFKQEMHGEVLTPAVNFQEGWAREFCGQSKHVYVCVECGKAL